MTKLATLGLVAGLLMSGTALATADDLTVNAGGSLGAGVNASGDNGSGNANATAAANASVNAAVSGDIDLSGANETSAQSYGELVSSVRGNAAVDLGTLSDSTTVNIVLVSSLAADSSARLKALDEALESDNTDQASLHTQIEGNAMLMAKLQASGFEADDVIALTTSADGTLTVWVDDRA